LVSLLEGSYRWSVVGQVDWVPSYCPSLQNRLNGYGVSDFSHGQCLIWQQGGCDRNQTVAFLTHLVQQWPAEPNQQTIIIGDRAPWHSRAAIVQQLL
jgi:hypothetical protein